jgi:type VI protein secretion system component VasK
MTKRRPLIWFFILLLGIAGDAWCFVTAASLGAIAAGPQAPGERLRLGTSAAAWLAGSAAFTLVALVALVRLLRAVARQSPSAEDPTAADDAP